MTLRLISATRTLYCGKDKTFSEGHSTFVAKQTKLVSLLDFIALWLDLKR